MASLGLDDPDFKPPDTKWGWVLLILGGVFLCAMIVGILYCLAVVVRDGFIGPNLK